MAYTTNNLSSVVASVEGVIGIWGYTTADSLATVKGAAYFADGVAKGLSVGDIIFVINTTTPAYAIYAVSSLNTTTGTATVAGTTMTF